MANLADRLKALGLLPGVTSSSIPLDDGHLNTYSETSHPAIFAYAFGVTSFALTFVLAWIYWSFRPLINMAIRAWLVNQRDRLRQRFMNVERGEVPSAHVVQNLYECVQDIANTPLQNNPFLGLFPLDQPVYENVRGLPATLTLERLPSCLIEIPLD